MKNQTTTRKSFILHKDSLEILDKLADEQAGKLFKAIKFYQKTKELPTLDFTLDLVFTPFLNQFIRDDEDYAKTCEARRIAGVKGGKQKVANASKSKQKVANLADSDSKSDSDSDSDSKSDLSFKEKFESFWNLYGKKLSKPDAEKKFKAALKKDTFENIMAGVERYIKTRSPDSQYWKHPNTWLNQECWKDEHIQPNQQPLQAITPFAAKLNKELGLNLFYDSIYSQNILTLKCVNKEALNQVFGLDETLKVKIRQLCQSEYKCQPNIIC